MASSAQSAVRLKARIAGVLYLLIIAGGLFAEAGVRQQLIVGGDAGATAASILANETLFRVGFSVNLAYLLCNVPFAVLFFEIFKVADKAVARLVMLLIVATTTIEAVNLLNQLSVIHLLTSPGNAAFSAAQVHQMAYAALQNFQGGFAVSLVFFGCVCLLYGHLIWISGLLPRALGALLALAGLCYLTNSFAIFLAPGFAALLFPYILLPCLAGELIFALWLVIGGVNTQTWGTLAARTI